MISKILFIRKIQDKYNIPLLVSGDIFDKWKPSPELLKLCIEILPEMVVIPGQHDLPRHSIGLYHQSGLGVLEAAGVATVLKNPKGEDYYPDKDWGNDKWFVTGYPFGSEPRLFDGRTARRSICMIHELVAYTKQPFPNAGAEKARGVLGRLEGYDVVLSGDNHQQFVLKHRNRLLVNPGCIFRANASLVDHIPKIYLWYSKDNTIEEVPIPIEDGVIIRDHIEKENERNNKRSVYIEKMKNDYSVGLKFKDNLTQHMVENKTSKPVKEIVWEWQ
jgi:DNA repair exonuclease SbcCD nuclease subunit